MCWCRFQRQVPEAGRFRRVPVCAGVGSGKLWRVPESSAAGWCRFRRHVAEASCGGKLRRQVVEASSGGM